MKKSARKTSRPRTAVPKTATLNVIAGEEMRSLMVHAIIYLLVNFGLFIYMYSNSQDLNLFYWIVAGWGVGLIAHALSVFGFMKILHKEW